ncbi:hydroxymethylbilane synthase [bacterium]|nr:hydroxymethylbilane synthase [bacterium]
MIIGTRGSELALVQANFVADALVSVEGKRPEISVIRTQGDRVTDRPLQALEGSGYFTKEIEEALLQNSIDIAVHSFKDMPSKSPEGLIVAAITLREDPSDLLIARKDIFRPGEGEIPLALGITVGTSAVRRKSQLQGIRKDIKTVDLRGNVPTRLMKLRKSLCDAIFLASAGVRRLNSDLSEFEVIALDPTRFIPSPGQGALAVQMRAGDSRMDKIRAALHDGTTATATKIERLVQARFGGGCGLPLGVYAQNVQGIWTVHGFWGEDEQNPKWATVSDKAPDKLAEELHKKLLKADK